ncbi:hypothetical protein ABPG72_011292 [Tetrahymena utriculariae]
MKNITFLQIVLLFILASGVVCQQTSNQCDLQITQLIQGIQGPLCSSQGYISNFKQDIISKQNFVNYAFSFWINPQPSFASGKDQIIGVVHSITDLIQFKDPYFALVLDEISIISVVFFSNGKKMTLSNSSYQKNNQWNYILVTVSQINASSLRVAIIYNSMDKIQQQQVSQIDLATSGQQLRLTLLSRFDSVCLQSSIGGFFFVQNIQINQINWESLIFNYFIQGGLFPSQIVAWYSTKFQDDNSVIPDLSGNLRYLTQSFFPPPYLQNYSIGQSQSSIVTFQEPWWQYSKQDQGLLNNFMISFWIKPNSLIQAQYLIIAAINDKIIAFDLFYMFQPNLQQYYLQTSNQQNLIYTSSNINDNNWTKVILKIFFDPSQNNHVIYVEENDEGYQPVFNKIQFPSFYYQKDSIAYYVGFGYNPYFKNFVITQGAFSSSSNNSIFKPQNCQYLSQCSSIQGILGSQNEYCISCVNGIYLDGSSMKCLNACPSNKQQINGECISLMYNWHCKEFDLSTNKCQKCNEGRIFNSDQNYCQCQKGFFDDRLQNICLQQFRHQSIYTGQFNFLANKLNQSVCSAQIINTVNTKYSCMLNNQFSQNGQIITSVIGIDVKTQDKSQSINYSLSGFFQQQNIVIQILINDHQLIFNEFIIQYMIISDQYLYQISNLSIDFTEQKYKSLSTTLTLNQNYIDQYSIAIFLQGAAILPPLNGQTDITSTQITSRFNHTTVLQSAQQIFNLEFTVSQRIQMLQYQILYFPTKPSYDYEIDLTQPMDNILQTQNQDNSYSPLFQYQHIFSQPFSFNDIFIYGISTFNFSYPKNYQMNINQFTYSFYNTNFQLQSLGNINQNGQDLQLYTQQQQITSVKISLTTKNSNFTISNFTLSIASSFSQCSKNCLSCYQTPEMCSSCSNPLMDISFPYCTKCLPSYINIGALQCRFGQKCGTVNQQVIFNCKQCNPYSREALCQQCVDGYQPNQYYSSCVKIQQSSNSTSCHFTCRTCSNSDFNSCQTCSSTQNNILISGTCYCNFFSYRFKLSPDCSESMIFEIVFKFEYILISILVLFSITQSVLQKANHLLWKYIEITQIISSYFYFNVYGLTLVDFVYRLAYLYNLSPIFPNPFSISILNNQNFQTLLNDFSQSTSSRFLVNYKSSQITQNIIPTFLFYAYLLLLVMIKQFTLFRTRKSASFFQGFQNRIIDALFFGFFFQSQELMMLIFMNFSKLYESQSLSSQDLALATLYWPILRVVCRCIISALLIFLQEKPKAQASIIIIFGLAYIYFYLTKPYKNQQTQIHIQSSSKVCKKCKLYLIKLNILEQIDEKQSPKTNLSDISMELQNNLSIVNNTILEEDFQRQSIKVQWQVNPIHAFNKKSKDNHNE